ncbi:MAG: type II CAAX endopeptidase family protein [Pseudomonadota bacterium]
MARLSVGPLFLGPGGKLLHFWRAAIFYVAANWVLSPLLERPSNIIAGLLHIPPGLTAGNIAFSELGTLLIALICTGVFAFYEHRRIDSYGMALDRAFRLPTLEGAIGGIAMAGAVALGMIALGGMQVRGFAGGGDTVWLFALQWLAANICIGIAEEMFYRGYLLQALWRSLGFWPAAILVALPFAADHYFYKTGENIWDVITLISLSLLLSYSVLRTGSLWFAIGFHIAFDYMQLFVIGTPNGAAFPVGRLLDVRFDGPWWLTGGVLGTEASFLMYPAITLLWLFVWRRYRGAETLRPGGV